ncbi:hypothetical protein BDZ88DRAFT_453729 [Geranomyces variabilis]|nr:hypothetical protein BDZ88DRAFT_453729 [Geranomyces variabilis]KAJ3136011.1 hypothetical protein HDU90_003413 [Geranomyces variabilis]
MASSSKREPRFVDYSDSDSDEDVMIKQEVLDDDSDSDDDDEVSVAGTVMIKQEVHAGDEDDDKTRIKMEDGGDESDGMSVSADESDGDEDESDEEEMRIKPEVVVPPSVNNKNNGTSARVVADTHNVAAAWIKRQANISAHHNHNAIVDAARANQVAEEEEEEEEEEGEVSVVRATIAALEREYHKNATIIAAINQISTESSSIKFKYANLSLLQRDSRIWAAELDAKFRKSMAKHRRDPTAARIWDAFVLKERPVWADLIEFAMKPIEGIAKDRRKVLLPFQQAVAHAVFVCEERNKSLVAEIRKEDPKVAKKMVATESVNVEPGNPSRSRNGGGGGGPLRSHGPGPIMNWGKPPYWPELRVGGAYAVCGDKVSKKSKRDAGRRKSRGPRPPKAAQAASNITGEPSTTIKLEVKQEYPQQQQFSQHYQYPEQRPYAGDHGVPIQQFSYGGGGGYYQAQPQQYLSGAGAYGYQY